MKNSFQRIYYCTSIDITRSNGPGVNEREFLTSLTKVWKGELAILSNLSQIEDKKAVLKVSKVSRNPVGFLFRELKVLWSLLKDQGDNTLYVFRIGIFPISVLLFALISRRRYVLKTSGDGNFQLLQDRGGLYKIIVLINQVLYKSIMKRAVFVDAVSQDHIDGVKTRYGLKESKLGVVDNAVNVDKFTPFRSPAAWEAARQELGFAAEDIVVGYTGNLPYSRGGKQVVELLAAHNKNRSDFSLKGLILGDDGDRDKLLELSKNLGVLGDVKVLGRVSYDQIQSFVGILDVGLSFLHPRHRGASEQKVRQYLSCGVPAIVTPGSSEFVEQARIGWVYELDQIEDVYLRIVEISKLGKEGKEQLSQRSREYALKYLSAIGQQEKRLKLWEEAW